MDSTVNNCFVSTNPQHSNAKHFRNNFREDSLTPLPMSWAYNNMLGTWPPLYTTTNKISATASSKITATDKENAKEFTKQGV